VVRDVLHIHALQVRSQWRTETKKNSELTSLWVCQSSSVLGAKLASLKTFYDWVARVAIVCIHVHPDIVIRRKEVCCSSSLSHHAQLAGVVRRGRTTRSLQELRAGNVASECVREAQYAIRRGRPWCVSSLCLRVAGWVIGRGNHASAGSDILLWPSPSKVYADATAGEGKSAPITGSTRWASPSARSARIKGAVRVHQESLIR